MTDWLEREALVTVKSYPTPSVKYHETVCIAAVTKEEGWIRLYPVQFRSMPKEQKFEKYQLIRYRMRKHSSDRRPESFRPDELSIEIVGALATSNDKDWSRRRDWIDPTLSPSMCEIKRQQAASGVSLGAFRPREVLDFVVKKDDSDWSPKKKLTMQQMRLFDETTSKLEKIPFVFKYKYLCADEACNGHEQSIIDWEINELYRNVRRTTASEEVIKRKMRDKFLGQMCDPKRDTVFFVGNHSRWPGSFMILGVFWPPKRAYRQRNLLD